jgi:hypothetical protein
MAKTSRSRARVGQVILFKRGGSPYWYLKYPIGIREIKHGKHAGKTKRKYNIKSTQQTALRQAELIAQEVDLQIFRGKMNVCSGRISVVALRSAFLEYQEKDTDNRFRHLRDLRGRTGTFESWASQKGITAAPTVTLEVAEMFVRYLRHDLALRDRTVKNYVTAVGSMFAWGQRRRPPLVDQNPFATGKNGNLRIAAGQPSRVWTKIRTKRTHHSRSSISSTPHWPPVTDNSARSWRFWPKRGCVSANCNS